MTPPTDDLPLRPRLHRSYYVIAIPNSDNVLFYREGRGVTLKPVGGSHLLKHLLSVVDGSRTVAEIATELAQFDSKLVISSLRTLHQKGLLEEGDASADLVDDTRSALRTFISNLAPQRVSQILDDLAEANVLIIGSGAVASSLLEMLDRCGVGQLISKPASDIMGFSPSGETVSSAIEFTPQPAPRARASTSATLRNVLADASLVVAALDHPDPDLLAAVNEGCLEQPVMLLPVVLSGHEGRLGPTCIPGRTACVECASLRAQSNLSRYEEYVLYEETMRRRPGENPFGRLPHFPGMLAGMAATEAFKVITNAYPAATYGRVVIMDLLTSESLSHDVLRVPRCPACGRHATRARGHCLSDRFPWFTSSADAP